MALCLPCQVRVALHGQCAARRPPAQLWHRTVKWSCLSQSPWNATSTCSPRVIFAKPTALLCLFSRRLKGNLFCSALPHDPTGPSNTLVGLTLKNSFIPQVSLLVLENKLRALAGYRALVWSSSPPSQNSHCTDKEVGTKRRVQSVDAESLWSNLG
jgi:hypothetical protein